MAHNTLFTPEYVRGLEDNQYFLMEQLDQVVSQLNDAAGWEIISGVGEDSMGLNLSTLKTTSAILRDMVETNPLFKRGNELRFAYCYARGWTMKNLKPGAQAAMEDPYNYDALFSSQARMTGLKARHTDGNRFVLKTKDKQLYVIPLSEIADAYLDENDRSRILYIKRTWTVNNTTRSVWYPTDNLRRSKTRIADSIKTSNGTEQVDKGGTMFHKAYNRQPGHTWGIPDFLPAMMWAKAYSAYLKDNATLVKAYSRIALKLSSASQDSARTASARIEQFRGIGGTAIHDQTTDISVMPTSGSNVNFVNGRPLAAMVASSFGVSVVALLSDPGTGGSYGVAETLDPPTILMAQLLQEDEREFYEDILKSFANPSLEIHFPSIEADAVYRQVQSLYQGQAQGVLHREEVRGRVLNLLDIETTKRSLPKPDGFNNWSDPNPPKTDPAAKVDPTPRQGNSGAAGSVDQGTNNDARDNGEYDN